MNLTKDQTQELAQRIFNELEGFMKEELQYQIEDMKDNDLLSWEYYSTVDDEREIIALVNDMVTTAVTVS